MKIGCRIYTNGRFSTPLLPNFCGDSSYLVMCRLPCDKAQKYCFQLMMKYGSILERSDWAQRFRASDTQRNCPGKETDVIELGVFEFKRGIPGYINQICRTRVS
jgi:hypothetical protein